MLEIFSHQLIDGQTAVVVAPDKDDYDVQFFLPSGAVLLEACLLVVYILFSSPEHKVLTVSYCDRSLSVVRRA